MIHLIIRGRNCEKYLKKCIGSLHEQTYPNWKAWIVLDKPKDYSVLVAQDLELTGKGKVEFMVNEEHLGLGRNIVEGIKFSKAQDEDIIAILDADDWLHPEALEIVEHMYRHHPECLLTYGSYVNASTGKRTKTSQPYPINARVRAHKWAGSHLKSFRYKLWRHFPINYLQDDKGKWAEAASDRGLMYGLMELAGMDRCRHINKELYIYRNVTPYTCKRDLQKKWDSIFRAKKPLKRIEDL